METTSIDEALLPFGEFVMEAAEIDGIIANDDWGFALTLGEIKIGMPIQLEIRTNDENRITLGASPPLYYVETSVMPVFHQLNLTIVASAG